MSIRYDILDTLQNYSRNKNRIVGNLKQYGPTYMELAEMILEEAYNIESNRYNFKVQIQNQHFIIENQFVQSGESIEPGTHLYGIVYFNKYMLPYTLRAPYGLSRSKLYKNKILDSTNDLSEIIKTGDQKQDLSESFKSNSIILINR